MPDEWPTEPPEPTDLRGNPFDMEYSVRRCPYCDEPIDSEEYVEHTTSCEASEGVVHIDYPNGLFGVVIPEQSGYVWQGKTGGFACRNVSIQGTLIPLGKIRTLNLDISAPKLKGKFDEFEDPEQARDIYLRGLRQSSDDPYGGVSLGARLISETLDGVYADDDAVREQKRETRDERLTAVWEEIDKNLSFTYERVAAPYGRPYTQEGLRWMNVTGENDSEDCIYAEPWVDALVEMDGPIAFYYPNSD